MKTQAKQRRVSPVVILVMILGMILIPAMTNKAYAAGTGTKDDPIIITDYDQLREQLQNVNYTNQMKTYLKLGNDILQQDERNKYNIIIYDDFVLDLAGHALSRTTYTTDHELFELRKGSSLQVINSSPNKGIIQSFNEDDAWVCIRVRSEATLIMGEGGKKEDIYIETGFSKHTLGTINFSTIDVDGEGTVTIYPGVYVGNKDMSWDSLLCRKNSKAYIYGGTFRFGLTLYELADAYVESARIEEVAVSNNCYFEVHPKFLVPGTIIYDGNGNVASDYIGVDGYFRVPETNYGPITIKNPKSLERVDFTTSVTEAEEDYTTADIISSVPNQYKLEVLHYKDTKGGVRYNTGTKIVLEKGQYYTIRIAVKGVNDYNAGASCAAYLNGVRGEWVAPGEYEFHAFAKWGKITVESVDDTNIINDIIDVKAIVTKTKSGNLNVLLSSPDERVTVSCTLTDSQGNIPSSLFHEYYIMRVTLEGKDHYEIGSDCGMRLNGELPLEKIGNNTYEFSIFINTNYNIDILLSRYIGKVNLVVPKLVAGEPLPEPVCTTDGVYIDGYEWHCNDVLLEPGYTAKHETYVLRVVVYTENGYQFSDYHVFYNGTEGNLVLYGDTYINSWIKEASLYCPHKNTTSRTKNATMMSNGSITVTCQDCGDVISYKTIYYPKKIVLSDDEFMYDGTEKKPTVTVYDSNNQTIDKKKYTVSYRDSEGNVVESPTERGIYQVVATVRGQRPEAGGQLTSTFYIYQGPVAVTSLTNSWYGITVKWQTVSKTVSGYYSYQVLRKAEGESEWTALTTTKSNSYYDKSVQNNIRYTYAIALIQNNDIDVDAGASMSGIYMAPPTIEAVTNQSGSVKVSWSAVEGADGYFVYRKDTQKGTWHMIGSTQKNLYFNDKTTENGTVYYYAIKSFKKVGTETVTSASSSAKNTIYLKNVFISSLTNGSAGSLTVVHSINDKATGYQIAYSTNSGMSGSKFVTKTGGNWTTIQATGLTKGKTYYVMVRPYITVAGYTFYGNWSAKKSFTLTK